MGEAGMVSIGIATADKRSNFCRRNQHAGIDVYTEAGLVRTHRGGLSVWPSGRCASVSEDRRADRLRVWPNGPELIEVVFRGPQNPSLERWTTTSVIIP